MEPETDRDARWATRKALAAEFAPELYAKAERIDPGDGRPWAELTDRERGYWVSLALFVTESSDWVKRVASVP